jgi:hypothetical protein
VDRQPVTHIKAVVGEYLKFDPIGQTVLVVDVVLALCPALGIQPLRRDMLIGFLDLLILDSIVAIELVG